MMNDDKNTKNVQAMIKQAFEDFYIVARDSVKGRMKGLKKDKKHFDVARGLVNMRAISKDPEKYFSRASTESAWRQRNADERKRHPEISEHDAYYIVQTPAMMAVNSADWAVVGEVWQKYSRFCDAVMHWEYARTSKEGNTRVGYYADQIQKIATEIHKKADVLRSNPIVGMLKNVKYSLTK